MGTKTSEGLRERLFESLDKFIKKEISSKEIEGICYLSEQIIKTANIELDFQREMNDSARLERDYNLKMLREKNTAAELLQITLQKVEEKC